MFKYELMYLAILCKVTFDFISTRIKTHYPLAIIHLRLKCHKIIMIYPHFSKRGFQVCFEHSYYITKL